MSSSRIKIIIPARWASTRLPGKPLADICGKPMVVRVCEQVKIALPDVELIVATDDERVVEAVEGNGYLCFFSKTPHVSGTDRLAETALSLGLSEDTRVINVQGDEPLIPIELLSSFFEFVVRLSSLQIATVACPFDSVSEVLDKNKVKLVASPAGNAVYFSRSPIPYNRELGVCNESLYSFKKHVGIYAYSTKTLFQVSQLKPTQNELTESLEQLRALDSGIEIKVFETKYSAVPGVDTETDLVKVQEIYRSMNGFH